MAPGSVADRGSRSRRGLVSQGARRRGRRVGGGCAPCRGDAGRDPDDTTPMQHASCSAVDNTGACGRATLRWHCDL